MMDGSDRFHVKMLSDTLEYLADCIAYTHNLCIKLTNFQLLIHYWTDIIEEPCIGDRHEP